MNREDIESLKAILLKQRQELEDTAEVATEAARPVELDQASVGRLSRMDAMQAQSMALEGVRRREVQLARIGGALRRLEGGDFGLCHCCGEEIDIRRLRFDPTVTRCVNCKEAS
jgi:DnaK suppressor protein